MTQTTKLSNTKIAQAMNSGIARVNLPWPTERLGAYGSHSLDGSHFPPEACDRAMDLYVSEALQIPEDAPVLVTGICAGRDNRLQPLIVVTIQPRGTERPANFSRANLW